MGLLSDRVAAANLEVEAGRGSFRVKYAKALYWM